MKRSILTAAALLLSAGLLTQVASAAEVGGEGQATANTYTGTSRYEHPLDTYETCDDSSYAGQYAARNAEEDALFQCKEAFNSDCIVIGTEWTSILSDEFIGYKACQATVTVHGYRLN